MTLLAVERIKLFSTRSPWWCAILALGVTIGFGAMFAAVGGMPGSQVTLSQTQIGYQFGMIVTMVMAALAVTTEYRFGTIRATFQAVPNRVAALLAKATVVSAMALVIGELAAFGSWFAARVLAPASDLALTTAGDWRQVAGVGLVFALAAIASLAVGLLIRQSAGAITLLMIWVLLVEGLIGLVPTIGDDIQQWMPFMAASHFLGSFSPPGMPLGHWASLGYFAAISVGLLTISLVVTVRRDA